MGKLRLVLVASMLLFGSAANAIPNYVDQFGREWLPLGNPYLSWVEIASICNNVSGECGGGVTWASSQDVAQLFYEIAGLPPGSLDDGVALFPDSEMRGELFASEFADTFAYSVGSSIDGDILEQYFDGFTRTLLFDPIYGFLPGRGFVFDTSNPSGYDQFEIGTFGSIFLEVASIEFGIWRYRNVPEPASILLFGAGLVGILFAHRKDLHCRPRRNPCHRIA